MSAGPAPGRVASPAAAVPIVAKDAGADDGADAEHDDVEGAERALELMLRRFAVRQNGVRLLRNSGSRLLVP